MRIYIKIMEFSVPEIFTRTFLFPFTLKMTASKPALLAQFSSVKAKTSNKYTNCINK